MQAPSAESEGSTEIQARVLVLHTGGALWADAIGIKGTRTEPFVRWLPGSGRTELGLVPAALSTMSCFQDARLAHLFVALSEGQVPTGESTQAALALASLWYWNASQRGLACARPLGGAVSPRYILAATGTLVEQPGSDGLFRYVIGPVSDIEAKVAALAAQDEGSAHIDLLVPRAQAGEAEAAVERHFDCRRSAVPHSWGLGGARRLRVHPVGDLEHLQDVVELVLAESRAMAAELEVGAVLEDRFVLQGLIGEGGAGSVWRAEDRSSGHAVALKVLHPHIARDPERLASFFRGARHMRLLNQGVARIVHSPGGHGPHRYIAMELVPNGSLHDAVVSGRVHPGIELVLAAIEPLAAAHAAGVVHGDVKPQNILLDAQERPVLVDFDLSRVLGTGSHTTRSLGSLAFCAPEVLTRGADAATACSDVYSLAMTALFVLHGDDLPVAALRTPCDFLEEVSAPSAIRWALSEALHTDPEARTQDARALGNALREATALGDGGPAYRGPSARLVRRGPVRLLAGLAVLAGLAALWGWTGSRSANERAEQAHAAQLREQMAEQAWRLADQQPAQSLALLHAAGRLDATSAAPLIARGAASLVIPTSEKVMSVAVGADGTLGVGLMGGDLLVFEAATGQQRWRAQTPLDRAKEVRIVGDLLAAWAPDARLRGRHDQPVVFHDLRTGQPTDLIRLSGSPDLLTFGPGVAASHAPDQILLWDLTTGLPARKIPLTPELGGSIAPDGRTALLFGAHETRLERASGVVKVGAPMRDRDLPLFRWSGDARRYARAGAATLNVYDAETMLPIAELQIDCHRRLFLDTTGRHAVCGGAGTAMTLIDLDRGRVTPLVGNSARLSVAAFFDGTLATGEFDGGVHLWDVQTGAMIASLEGHTALVGAVVLMGSDRLVTGGQDYTVRIWDLSALVPARELVATDLQGQVAIRGDRVAWRGADGLLRVDDVVLGPSPPDSVPRWSLTGEHLTTSGGEGALWSLRGERVALGRMRVVAAAESPEGLRLITSSTLDSLEVRTLGGPVHTTPRSTWTLVQDLVWASPELALVFPYKGEVVGLSPEGLPTVRFSGLDEGVTDYRIADTRMLAGSYSTRVGIWDLRSGASLVSFEGHTEEVVSVDWHGDLVATGSWDATARLWDATSGALLHTLHPDSGDVVGVAFSPDGSRLAVLSSTLTTRLYGTADGAFQALLPGSQASQVRWTEAGLLTVEVDGTIRRWLPPEPPPGGWARSALAHNNLRPCPDGRVVPVLPWPKPDQQLAPPEACALRAEPDAPAG